MLHFVFYGHGSCGIGWVDAVSAADAELLQYNVAVH